MLFWYILKSPREMDWHESEKADLYLLCSWLIVSVLSATLVSPKYRKFWMISLKNAGNLVVFFMLRYKNKLGRIHKENGM